jgi:hypothetical protein
MECDMEMIENGTIEADSFSSFHFNGFLLSCFWAASPDGTGYQFYFSISAAAQFLLSCFPTHHDVLYHPKKYDADLSVFRNLVASLKKTNSADLILRRLDGESKQLQYIALGLLPSLLQMKLVLLAQKLALGDAPVADVIVVTFPPPLSVLRS